jgi:ATP-dependent DNA helicase RecQ
VREEIIECFESAHYSITSRRRISPGLSTSPPAEEDAAQTDFMEDRMPVIAATCAFGMGVDKPNVRFVFHYGASNSLDAYYQELGRAGCDGAQAQAWLLYRPQDLNLHKFFASGGQLHADDLEEIAEGVHEEGVLDQEVLREKVDISRPKLAKAIARLAEEGVIQSSGAGEISASAGARDLRGAAHEAVKDQKRHRQYLLDYCGEVSESCSFCGERGLPEQASVTKDRPFAIKTRVIHKKWGKRVVTHHDADNLTVLFHALGETVLAVDFIVQHKLLARALGPHWYAAVMT